MTDLPHKFVPVTSRGEPIAQRLRFVRLTVSYAGECKPERWVQLLASAVEEADASGSTRVVLKEVEAPPEPMTPVDALRFAQAMRRWKRGQP